MFYFQVTGQVILGNKLKVSFPDPDECLTIPEGCEAKIHFTLVRMSKNPRPSLFSCLGISVRP